MIDKRRRFEASLRNTASITMCLLGILTVLLAQEQEGAAHTRIAPSRTFAVQGIRATFEEIQGRASHLRSSDGSAIPRFASKYPPRDPVSSAMTASPDAAWPVRSEELQMTEAAPPTLLRSFPGLMDNGWYPPDTHGAAGPNHLISITNGAVDPAGAFSILDKTTGAIVLGPISLDQFWLPVCGVHGNQFVNCNPVLFDPKVEFDASSGRFIVTSARGYDYKYVSWVHVAVSNSSDPTQGFTYFSLDATASTPGEFADFPQLGVDPASVTITNYMLTFSTMTQGPQWAPAKFWVIDKGSLLSGGPARVSEFLDSTLARVWQPTQSFDPDPVTYLVSVDWVKGQSKGQNPLLRMLRVTAPGGNPVLSDMGSILIRDFGFIGQDAPQSGCGERLDTGYSHLLNAVLRNGHVYTTHLVSSQARADAEKTEIAWYEIDPAAASPCSAKQKCGTPVQQGRIADPSLWFYYPSIAVNSRGDIALGFSGSSVGTYPSAYYTARQASDPPGTIAPPALLKSGLSPYVKKGSSDGSNRWGDYSATVVDPADDLSFWTVQEYADAQVAPGCPTDGTGRWGTVWGIFSVGTP